jgi:Tfp pilus assembly protein PilX
MNVPANLPPVNASMNAPVPHHFPQRSRQAGVALIVGLVLLMVLTVLAISTMRTATLELLMAGNAQFRENAFRIAEAGLAAQTRALTVDSSPLDLAPDCPAPGDPELPAGPPVSVPDLQGSYTLRLCREGLTSLVSGSSIGKVSQIHYQAVADGNTDQRGARARLVQGFFQLVPEP